MNHVLCEIGKTDLFMIVQRRQRIIISLFHGADSSSSLFYICRFLRCRIMLHSPSLWLLMYWNDGLTTIRYQGIHQVHDGESFTVVLNHFTIDWNWIREGPEYMRQGEVSRTSRKSLYLAHVWPSFNMQAIFCKSLHFPKWLKNFKIQGFPPPNP